MALRGHAHKAIVLALDGGAALSHASDGQPFLGHVLHAVRKNMVEVVACVRDEPERVRDYCVFEHSELFYEFVLDPSPVRSGSAYGAYLARSCFEDGHIVLVNATVAFPRELMTKVVATEATCVAVDWGTYDRDSWKVSVREGRVLSLARQTFQEEAFGRAIGIYKIHARDVARFCRELERVIERFRDRDKALETVLDQLFISGVLNALPCKSDGARWEVAAVPDSDGPEDVGDLLMRLAGGG